MPKESPLEKVGESSFNDVVKKYGDLHIKLLPVSLVGIPDRMVLMYGGKIFFIEWKREGKGPSKIQLYIHKKLRKMGFRVYVCDSQQGAIDVYRKEKGI